MLRATVETAATAQVGSRRLSGAEARQRLQAGGGTATMTKKLLGRRTDEVTGLMAAGDGVMMPAPERQCKGLR